MAKISFYVNGKPQTVTSWDPDEPLLYALRNRLGLHGPKFGCGLGQCGACSVLLDGEVARACVLPLAGLAGKKIITIEGLGSPARPHPVQAAFVAEQAAQCGYCTNGMVMAAVALLRHTPKPSAAEVKEAFAANLCRCGTHTRILSAVLRAAKA